jgi:hypothetical protein
VPITIIVLDENDNPPDFQNVSTLFAKVNFVANIVQMKLNSVLEEYFQVDTRPKIWKNNEHNARFIEVLERKNSDSFFGYI